jgi:hypothetical protein
LLDFKTLLFVPWLLQKYVGKAGPQAAQRSLDDRQQHSSTQECIVFAQGSIPGIDEEKESRKQGCQAQEESRSFIATQADCFGEKEEQGKGHKFRKRLEGALREEKMNLMQDMGTTSF